MHLRRVQPSRSSLLLVTFHSREVILLAVLVPVELIIGLRGWKTRLYGRRVNILRAKRSITLIVKALAAKALCLSPVLLSSRTGLRILSLSAAS